MIKPLRKKMVVKITMWILLVTFVLWGAASVTMTSRNYMGVVFGRKISPQEYNRSYTAVLNRAKIMYGDNLSKIQNFLNLDQQAWDRLVLLQYAKKKHIRAGNQEVVARISQMPFFQSGGAFDQRAYSYILQNVFLTNAHDFEEATREDIIISKSLDSAVKDIDVPDQDIAEAYRLKNEKADISYVLIDAESFKKDVAYDEKELETFYNAHKDMFFTPERITIYYIKIPVDEKQPDAAKKLAFDINDSINLGDSFESLAQKYNLKIEQTGAFSFTEPVPGVGLSYPFSIAAFALTDDKSVDIVEEKDAFYVIKLKEKIKPYTPPLEEIKERVRNALVAYKADELAKAVANNAFEILKSNKETIEAIAKQLNAPLNNLKDITRESYVNGVGLNKEFNSACFSVEEKETAFPVKTEKGYCLIRPDTLKGVDKAAFEKEKEDFKKQLISEKRSKMFEEWFAKIKKQANLTIVKP
ncbi:MAG: SurA N-terminal domain-containing protein [Candidatus Omnitrophica bacterium]|nr:SurA N-terminal domain-containing protein [Candidatus Omnitrophota bacterium]